MVSESKTRRRHRLARVRLVGGRPRKAVSTKAGKEASDGGVMPLPLKCCHDPSAAQPGAPKCGAKKRTELLRDDSGAEGRQERVVRVPWHSKRTVENLTQPGGCD